MFKLVRIRESFDQGKTYVGGAWYSIFYKQGADAAQPVCVIQNWTMGSCAARNCSHFNPRFLWNEQRVQDFLEFLDNTDEDYYKSREVYFFLTTQQLDNMKLNLLVEQENMHKIDAFQNRGNGGDGHMQLWRWSNPREATQEEEEEE